MPTDVVAAMAMTAGVVCEMRWPVIEPSVSRAAWRRGAGAVEEAGVVMGGLDICREHISALPMLASGAQFLFGGLADMFQRFALGKATQTVLMSGDIAQDFIRIDARILAQGPADRLAKEEFL